MLRRILIFVVVCLGIISFNSSAVAGVNLTTWYETDAYLDVVWGWNPEAADTLSNTGTWWDSSLTIADGGTTWDVTWTFTHIDGPHVYDQDPNPFSKSASFNKSSFGIVLSDSGVDLHAPHVADADVWDFEFDRNATPANTGIALDVYHAPEPISSLLFVTGAATLGFRRLWKKRRNT